MPNKKFIFCLATEQNLQLNQIIQVVLNGVGVIVDYGNGYFLAGKGSYLVPDFGGNNFPSSIFFDHWANRNTLNSSYFGFGFDFFFQVLLII